MIHCALKCSSCPNLTNDTRPPSKAQRSPNRNPHFPSHMLTAVCRLPSHVPSEHFFRDENIKTIVRGVIVHDFFPFVRHAPNHIRKNKLPVFPDRGALHIIIVHTKTERKENKEQDPNGAPSRKEPALDEKSCEDERCVQRKDSAITGRGSTPPQNDPINAHDESI